MFGGGLYDQVGLGDQITNYTITYYNLNKLCASSTGRIQF